MNTLKAKFCQYCSKELVMRYPGGDPENGPAGFRCRDNTHESPSDEAYTRAVLLADAFVEEFPELNREEAWERIVNLVLKVERS